MELSIKKIAEAAKGKLITASDPTEKLSISTDTRALNNTNIFLPIKGANFDGHSFINKAIEKGCRGYFVDNNHANYEPAEFVISVDNTLEAYLNIANYIRREINPKIIAITGSSGKTTTKEFIYSVLSTSFNTHKSILNHNNEIGLCQTMLSMPESTQYAVIEMGMRGLGEIELLSKYSEPDIAVITNIGTAHIGRLKSIENIAKAKYEITSHLKESGILIAYDEDLIRESCNWDGEKIFYGKDYEITKKEEALTGFIYKDEYYEIPVMGNYNVINSIAAIEIGKIAGISYENIKKGLMNYAPVGDRDKIITLSNGTKLVVDCYNANPNSVIASINNMTETYKGLKITLVLGDMAELGEHEEELHKKVGNFISEHPVYELITVGERAKSIADGVTNENIQVNSFLNNEEASTYLLNNLEKDSIILFKASRCMKLEQIAETLQAET